MRIALVSCVKSKGMTPAPARDLYTSQLFKGMRRYAESKADAWYILSAKYGVVLPDEVIEPYEQTLNRMTKDERTAWAERVQQSLYGLFPAGVTVVLLAGERYREGIIPFLEARGVVIEAPMAGLGIGSQLKWLKENGS